VAVNVVIAALLSPYVIRHLGEAQFSVWTLALSFIEYFWLIDIGLRSSTVKFSADFRAVGDNAKLTDLVNTGMLYAITAGTLIALAAVLGSKYIAGFFHIAEPAFPFLISMVGISWAFGMSMSILTAVLEGFQRFDVITRVWLAGTVLRSAGTAVLVYLGYGIYEMGIIMFVAQVLMTLLTVMVFSGIVSGIRISVRRASMPMLRQMAAFGAHSFKILISTRVLNQSAPFLIAYFLPIANVAYYIVPTRILDMISDAIGRIGMVTTPNAAEMLATGRSDQIAQLGISANRYSLTLFAPVTVFLLVYVRELFTLWVKPEFGVYSAALIPVLLISATTAAGQHNSVSILFGIGRHQRYSTCLVIEAALNVAGMFFLLPRFGLFGAVCWSVTLMTINRGLIACLLVCKELKLSPASYAGSIYLPPLSAAGITAAVLFALKPFLPGTSWGSLILAGVILAVVYLPLAFFISVSREHRQKLLGYLSAYRRREATHQA